MSTTTETTARDFSKADTHQIQTWPAGTGYRYQGDLHGPAAQRRLQTINYNGPDRDEWRDGTAEEWRQIRINVAAERYGDREIHGCDSALVDDLIKAASSGELRGDLGNAFQYEELRNLYTDCSDYDVDQCRDYAYDNGIDLPDEPTRTCDACNGTGDAPTDAAGEPVSDRCADCNGTGRVLDADDLEDDRHGWLRDAREACMEHAQENPAEVYEWWRVSSWLCGQLDQHGYVTIDNDYGYWWGRTCTGQGWIMDGVLQTIAASFEKDGQ